MIGKETIGHLDLTLKTIKQNSLQFCGVFLLAVGQLPSIGEGNLFFLRARPTQIFWQIKIMILISHINIYFSLLLIFYRIWSFSESWSKVMWSISYVNCVDIITQVSLIQRLIFFDVPTLKLRIIIIILPTDWPEIVLSTVRKTKN